MRLRRKPWIDEAIHEYDSHIILSGQEQYKGKWRELFAHPERPLYMELGTGKGRFIAGMAEAYPDANFVGFEVQIGVIYYAAQKIFEARYLSLISLALKRLLRQVKLIASISTSVTHGLRQNMLSVASHIIHSSTVMLVF